MTRGRHPARWTALGVGVVLVAFGVVLAVQHRTEASVPRLVQDHGVAPTFTTKTLDGKPIDSRTLKGKTYVVNVWNTWCIPCRDEASALRTFYARHASEPDFAMIGLVRDDSTAPVRSYVASKKVTWPVVFDDRLLTEFGTTGQPETYVVSPSGVAVCGRLGATTLTELEAWLQVARSGSACA